MSHETSAVGAEKTIRIANQYVVDSYAKALVRPYLLSARPSTAIAGEFGIEKLPEDGHWRVRLAFVVTSTVEDQTCFEAGCALEAIVVARNTDDAETETYLRRSIAGLLVGDIRVRLANMTQGTGYGPITLPPLSAEQLERLVAKGASAS